MSPPNRNRHARGRKQKTPAQDKSLAVNNDIPKHSQPKPQGSTNVIDNKREKKDRQTGGEHTPAKKRGRRRRCPVSKKANAQKHKPRREPDIESSAFLRLLPGEIRNRIYEYVIPSARILVCATRPNLVVAAVAKLWENEGKRIQQPRSRLYCILDREQLHAGLEMSSSLLLVSKQISQEVQHFLYMRTTFCFPNLKTITKFLNNAPSSAISSIEKIELETHCYGEPFLTKNRLFKVRYDHKWDSVCRMLGSKMTSLSSFKLHTHCLDWPFGKFEDTSWYMSLMQVTGRKKLDEFKIVLASSWLCGTKLDKVERKLQVGMTTSASRQRSRPDQVPQASTASAVRVTKCLRIVMKDTPPRT